MKNCIPIICRCCYLSILLSLVVLALALSLLRWYWPQLVNQPERFSATLSALSQRAVTVESVATYWTMFRPGLKLNNIQIAGPDDTAEPLDIPSITLAVNLWQSLLQRTWVLDDITVYGVDLKIVRRADGFIIQNTLLPLSGKADKSWQLPDWLFDRTIALVDCAINYRDIEHDIAYQLRNIDLATRLDQAEKRFYLSIDLPDELGQALDIGFDLQGELNDPASLTGKVYIKASAIQLASWLDSLGYEQYLLRGVADFELWGTLSQIDNFVGRVSINDLVLRLPHLANPKGRYRPWSIAQLNADLKTVISADTLSVAVENLQIQQPNITWPMTGFNLQTTLTADKRWQQGQLAVDYWHFSSVNDWLTLFAQQHRLREYDIRDISTDLSELYIAWDQTNPESPLVLQGNFARLNVIGYDRMPSIQNFKGSLRLLQNQLQIDFLTGAASFDYPFLFRQPWELTEFTGRILAQPADVGWYLQGRDIKVSTSSIQSQHWFDLQLTAGKRPIIASYSQFHDSFVESLYPYLPYRIIPEKTLAWLDQLLLNGQTSVGVIEMRGALDKSMILAQDNLFRIEFFVTDSTLKYLPDWPVANAAKVHMRFLGATITGDLLQADVTGSQINTAYFTVPDLQQPKLHLQLQAQGSNQAMLAFIKNSPPLAQIFAPLIPQLAMAGEQITDLVFTTPLNESAATESRLQAITQIKDGAIKFADWGLQFSDINQRFYYATDQLYASKFKAQLNQQPVTLAMNTRTDAAGVNIAQIDMQGDLDIAALLSSKVAISDYLTGRSWYTSSIRLPFRNNSAATEIPISLRLSSNLEGTLVKLPEPFAKTAAEAAELKLQLTLANPQQMILDGEYKQQLLSQLVWQKSAQNWSLYQLRFGINQSLPAFTDPDPGIWLQAQLPALDLKQWEFLWNSEQTNKSVLPPIKQFNLTTAKLNYANLAIDDIQIKITELVDNWLLSAQSTAVNGDLMIPVANSRYDQWIGRLQQLDLRAIQWKQTADPSTAKAGLLPQNFPSIELFVEELYFLNWQINKFHMVTQPTEQGLNIRTLDISDPAVGMRGSGAWQYSNGQHQTILDLQFDSNNFGLGMERFGHLQTIKGGQGIIDANLRWPAAPYQFSLAELTGDAKVDVANGQILELSPGGGGRILGLLSIQALPKRLSLDFNDVFGKGLNFDTMYGEFKFADGNAHTDNYVIDGSMGRIRIQGRTGLVVQDYDQLIEFRPDLSSSLPIIGTLIGGPVAGAAIIAGDQFARLFGKQTDDLVTVNYRLTGSWNEPILEVQSRRRKNNSEQQQTKTPVVPKN